MSAATSEVLSIGPGLDGCRLVGTATACPGLFRDGLAVLNDDVCWSGFTLLVDPPSDACLGNEWEEPSPELVVAL